MSHDERDQQHSGSRWESAPTPQGPSGEHHLPPPADPEATAVPSARPATRSRSLRGRGTVAGDHGFGAPPGFGQGASDADDPFDAPELDEPGARDSGDGSSDDGGSDT